MSHDPGQSRPDADRLPVAAGGLQELEPRLLLSASVTDPFEPLPPAGSSQDERVALAAGDLTFGIDVSHWQGSINWTSVVNDGIDFVWAKATEGVDYIDPRWLQNVTGAHNAGLYVSGYHFATPYTGGVNDAAAEASDFYDAVAPYLTDGYLRPALDLEGGASLSTTVLSNWVHDFMNAFKSLSGGIEPIIYVNTNYATNELNSSVNVYDLWLANWTHNPNNPPAGNADGVWTGYDLWQYSDSTSVPGISGDVDGDVFFGNLSELAAKYVINTTPDDHGDDLANATVVGMPSVTAGVIGSLADVDWFEVTLTASEAYTFSVLADGLASAELKLYTNTGTPVATDTGSASGGTLAELQFTPVVGGVYYLSVGSSGAGGYDLAVQETDDHGDSIAAASALGALAIGDLQTATDKDYFHFSATAGMIYDINVTSLGLPDAILTLYNSGDGIVSQQPGSSAATPMVHIQWTAGADGQMYLAMSSNTGAMGDYAVTLAESSPPLDGDLDDDGFVGINDLNVVLGNWNQSVTAGVWLLGDPSGDGFVGIEDLNLVLGNWNAGTPPAVDAVATSQAEVTALAGGTQILGIDVSHWQAGINWVSVAASGKEFAFIRALDRDGLLDTRFLYNIVQSKANGIWAGAYQFVTPWTDGYNDAVEEATLFATTIAPYLTGGYLRPVIDIEAGPPHEPYPMDLDNTVLTDWVHDYMAEFVRLTGIEPLIYTNTSHAKNAFDSDVNVYDLWLANWTNDPNVLPTNNPDGVWNGYDFWQYSSTTSVPGISGNVDGDVYFGSVADMIADYGIVIAPDDHGNELADATVMGVPSSVLGNVNTILDEDWFAVTLAPGQAYTFSLLGGTLDDAQFALYSETGTLLASTTGPGPDGLLGQLQYAPAIGGTYHLRVMSTDLGVGSYGLSVQETDEHGDSIAEATDLVGGIALGGIQVSGDQDFFHFTAEAGKQYDFKAIDFGIPDAVLTLYDAEGAVVDQQAGSNPGGTHAQLIWTAGSPAQMYVAVSADAGSYGDYVLTLTVTDAPAPLDGDLDSDGFVGINDLNIVLGNWNQNVTAGDWAQGDPSGDGFVGIEDMNVVLGNWNAGTPPVVQAIATSLSEESSAPDTQTTDVQTSRERKAMSSRAQLAHSVALANWRAEARSAFGQDKESRYTPAIGLWEPDTMAR